jgi:hypothetical protein
VSFTNPVVAGGGSLIKESVHSPDYVAGVSGWSINRDGSAEFNNVTIRLDLTTGGIVVGPDTGPQVIIRVADDGLGDVSGVIDFPTNVVYEHLPAAIFSSIEPTERLRLLMRSGQTDVGAVLSQLELISGENGTGDDVTAKLRAQRTPTVFSELELREDNAYLYVDGASGFSQIRVTLSDDLGHFAMVASDEVYAADSGNDGNYLARVTSGKVSTSVTNTTLSNVSDTAVGNATVPTAFLETGFAYEVRVELSTRSSVGTSAAGTQGFNWKLWNGAVGGTQLGTTVETTNTSVGMTRGRQVFTFVFEHTGANSANTLTLSGFHSAGADTLQARVDTGFVMLVKKIGDPARITNL